MKKVVWLTIAALLILAAIPANVTAQEEPLEIFMVQHALCAWDSFWCVVEKGIADAAEDYGVNVTVLGPDAFDVQKVAELIEQAVAAQPDGLGITVTDAVLFKEPLTRAIDQGIPVVGYNTGRGPAADDIPYLTHFGQDEYQGGYQGGQRLAAAGGTNGVCINHQVGNTALDQRCQGFVDAFTDAGLTAQVLSITNDPAESQTIIDDFFSANADIDAFLTLGPNGANPFYAFVEGAGLEAGGFVHGTFDLSPEIVAMIKDGTTLFGIDQQPYLQGYLAVQWLVWVNRYGFTPPGPITPTGPGFVDASNVALVEELAGTYR
ncbi:MAG: sugar ABC transporter substrate-binding protein [Anaerolineae bacterium]|nr:sugar ABC transporter substrate-binding protein [Anaerolineae bacterium]